MKTVLTALFLTLAGSGLAFQSTLVPNTSPEIEKAHRDFDREVEKAAALIRSLPQQNRLASVEVGR